jgi:hypothetical protein
MKKNRDYEADEIMEVTRYTKKGEKYRLEKAIPNFRAGI